MIQLTPVLNKKDLENIKAYQSMPYSQLYKEKDEWDIYNIVKSVRKENQLPNKKIKPDDADSISEYMISNKPKDWSILKNWWDFLSNSKKIIDILSTLKSQWEDVIKPIKEKEDELVWKATEKLYNIWKPVLNVWMWILDYWQQNIIWKPASIITAAPYKAYSVFNWILEEWLWKAVDVKKWKTTIPEAILSTPSIIKTWISKWKEDRELFQLKNDIIYWTNTRNLWDFLNFKTSEEKVKETINAYPQYKDELQSFADENKATRTAIQILWWVASWLWTSQALWRWALKLSTMWATWEKAAKVLSNFQKYYDKTALNWLPALWAFVAANTWLHYLATWENLLSWDEETTNNVLWSIFIKAMPEAFKVLYKTWKYTSKEILSPLFENKEFKKGFSNFMTDLKDDLWNKVTDFAEWQWLVPRIIDETKKSVSKEKPILNEVIDDVNIRVKEQEDIAKINQLLEEWRRLPSKPSLKEKAIEKTTKLRDLFFERSNEDLVKFLWIKWEKADYVLWDLKAINNRWRSKVLFDDIEQIIKPLSPDDKLQLNEYMMLKNRYQQTINREANLEKLWKHWELKTGKWTKELMQKYLSWTEKDNYIIKETADKIHNITKVVLDDLLDSWIINKWEYDWLRQNPYYIPSKLTDESLDIIWRDWIKRQWEQLIKTLKWWSEELNFSTTDSLYNLYNFYSKSLNIANKNRYIKNIAKYAKEIWNDLDVTPWKDLTKFSKEWFEKYSYKYNWEVKEVMLPKYIIERLNKTKFDNKTISALKPFQAAVALSKTFTTWWLAPKFWLSQLPTETLLSSLYTWKEWWDMKEFFTLTANRLLSKLWRKKEYYDLVSDFISSSWADFAWAKFAQEDLDKVFNPSTVWLHLWKKSKFVKFLSNMNYIAAWFDKWWPRWPAFMADVMAQFKKIWKTKWDFEKLITKYNIWTEKNPVLDYTGFTNELIKLWVSANKARKTANDIFDYNAVSDAMKFSGSLQPYLNITATNIDAIKKLLTKWDKKKIASIIWWFSSMAYMNYWYNFLRDEQAWEELRSRWWTIRAQPWLHYVDNEWNSHFTQPFTNNNSLYNFIYWLTYLMWEANRIWTKDAVKEWFWRTTQDFTYFFDLQNWVLDSLRTKFNVPILKQILETSLNKDFRYWWQIYNEWYWLNDINPQVSDLVKAIWVATDLYNRNLSDDYSENELWIKSWWFQYNPVAVSRFLSWADPTQFSTYKTLSKMIKKFTEDWEWDSTKISEELLKFFTREFKPQNQTLNDIYKSREDLSIQTKLVNNQIKNLVKWASTKEELWKIYSTYSKNIFNDFWDWKELKYLINEVKDKKKEIEWWKLAWVIWDFTAEELWKVLAEKYKNKDWKWYEEIRNQINKAWFKTNKINDIIKYFNEYK